MIKFICSECGEEMEEDCDMCEDCYFEEQEQDDLKDE